MFRGEGKGKFTPGLTLKDKDGKEIKIGSASTVFACDWRDTGKLDLLVGDISGDVWLLTNEGTRTKPAYGAPVKLSAAGKEIMSQHGDSHPIMADWENNGKPGLILGGGDGSVQWFRNIGTRKEPKLDNPVTLVSGTDIFSPEKADSNSKPKHGSRAKVCVVDWNGDGHLDLLVGDFSSGMAAPPKLTEAEKKEFEALKAKTADIQKELKPYIDAVQKASQEAAKIKDPKERQEKMNKVYQEMAKRYESVINKQRDHYQALSKYQGSHQYHGYVWLYLRKTDGKAAVEKSR